MSAFDIEAVTLSDGRVFEVRPPFAAEFRALAKFPPVARVMALTALCASVPVDDMLALPGDDREALRRAMARRYEAWKALPPSFRRAAERAVIASSGVSYE